MTTPQEQARDPRYERGDEPLFGGQEFSERFPDHHRPMERLHRR